MTLTIINGSPRNKKSNSRILVDHFVAGYRNTHPDPRVQILYLAERTSKDEVINAFIQSKEIILIFPLYTDCMPGIVKGFFEIISNLDDYQGKKIGFIVQSGFPEAIHSVYVEKYLNKLAQRWNCQYLGTIIKGGVEGIQEMPAAITRKLFSQFYKLGQVYGSTGLFSVEIVAKLRHPMHMSRLQQIGFKLLSLTGLTNYYWNSQLKKNGAFGQKSNQPYAITN